MQSEYEVKGGFLEALESLKPGITEALNLKGGERLPFSFKPGREVFRLDLPGRDLESEFVDRIEGVHTPCLMLRKHPDELARLHRAHLDRVETPPLAVGDTVTEGSIDYRVLGVEGRKARLVPVDARRHGGDVRVVPDIDALLRDGSFRVGSKEDGSEAEGAATRVEEAYVEPSFEPGERLHDGDRFYVVEKRDGNKALLKPEDPTDDAVKPVKVDTALEKRTFRKV